MHGKNVDPTILLFHYFSASALLSEIFLF